MKLPMTPRLAIPVGWIRLAAALVAAGPLLVPAEDRPWPSPATAGLTRNAPVALIGKATLPLSFEINRGQVDPQVKFLARAPDMTAFLRRDGAVFSLGRSDNRTSTLRMRFRGGAVSPEASGADLLPG